MSCRENDKILERAYEVLDDLGYDLDEVGDLDLDIAFEIINVGADKKAVQEIFYSLHDADQTAKEDYRVREHNKGEWAK